MPYPDYFKHTKSKLVIEFISLCSGTVIQSDGGHQIGEIRDDWVEHTSTIWTQVEDPRIPIINLYF